jgi:hypothetical protein
LPKPWPKSACAKRGLAIRSCSRSRPRWCRCRLQRRP